MPKLENTRLLMIVRAHRYTLHLLEGTEPMPIGVVSYLLDDEDVAAYRLDLAAASAQVDELSWEDFYPFLLGLPALYGPVPDDYWDDLMTKIGMVHGDPLDRFLTWCGEAWAWTD